MATSIRDIKARVTATKKTAQITNAMNMVSASKMKSAQKATTSFRPYMERVEDVISSLAGSNGELHHPLLEQREVKRTCYVLITSDRGLAGPFNSNVCKLVSKEINDKNACVFAFGSKGYQYCKNRKIELYEDDYIESPDDVPFDSILYLISKLVKDYLTGKIDEVVMVYNHFVNTLRIEPTVKRILPIDKNFSSDTVKANYEFDEPVEEILGRVLPLYLENLVYGIVLDSKASEHASRMTAMSSATDNAEEVIEKLTLVYNRARQSAITLELTDIIGGSNAINEGE